MSFLEKLSKTTVNSYFYKTIEFETFHLNIPYKIIPVTNQFHNSAKIKCSDGHRHRDKEILYLTGVKFNLTKKDRCYRYFHNVWCATNLRCLWTLRKNNSKGRKIGWIFNLLMLMRLFCLNLSISPTKIKFTHLRKEE